MPARNFVLRKVKREPWIRATGHDLHYEGDSMLHALEGGGKVFYLFAPSKQTKPHRRSANTNFDKEEI